MPERFVLPIHGEDHRPVGFNGPDDPGGPDPIPFSPSAAGGAMWAYMAWMQGMQLPADEENILIDRWDEAWISEEADADGDLFVQDTDTDFRMWYKKADPAIFIVDVSVSWSYDTDGPPVSGDWFGIGNLIGASGATFGNHDVNNYDPADLIIEFAFNRTTNLVKLRALSPGFSGSSIFTVELQNLCNGKVMWVDEVHMHVIKMASGEAVEYP